jgi:hypothetical protein
MRKYAYYINCDERGEFRADVRRERTGKTIFEIDGHEIFEDGFMRHGNDLAGLRSYLMHLGILRPCDRLDAGN